MEHNSLGCQVCLTTFNKMCDLKQHMRSRAHQEKMEEVFQKDKFKGSGFFPSIIVMDPLSKHEMKQPIIGLSLLTMCFSRETKTFFYLCHVCEEKRPPDKILHHLASGDHCSNYFNYTNPNVLSFSWVPSMDMRVVLRPEITKEVKERGPGQLQMLDLPENLLKKLETSTYFEVMRALSENDKLLKLFEAVKPKRTMIQTYQRDRNRKHPLLGMQHLVECICVGPTEKRYYLCTLCNLTLATHAIIKHVLSFDHIFSYFRAWHPSTLVSKECYKDYTKQFASEILDFAKQTEEIHGTANTDMKQMSLEPGEFQSVNFACYAKALKELESITKEKKESSLITSVKPGKKLEFRIQSARPVASCYKLRCQDCSMNFKTISPYLQHLTKWNHKQMLKKFFGEAGYDQTGTKPNLGLYRYLLESTKQNQPAIGVPLVVTCVNTEVQGEAIYVCFACEDCFPESLLRQHFNSRKHLIHTLLYQNPWRLPFAWENPLDVEVLRSMAWDEEKERGPNQMLLKVLDMPYWMFQRLIPPSYPKVMERLKLYHTLLKREVPQRENRKLLQSERFPLLGQQFLVMHVVCVRPHQSTEVGSLCLLCERRLSHDECYAHVFSREHVGKFLDRFHPGSQNSSTDAETLLDLAKQAAHVHSISHVQVVKLDKPIWEPCSYHRAISILTSAKKRDRKGKLEPEIMPKQKLFPRETLKEVDKDHMRDNSQKNGRMMEGSVKNPSQKSTENTVKVGAEMTNTKCGENAEKGADEETPTPSEKESEKRREVFSKTSSEEIKNAGSDTCQAIKEEKIEEPTEIGEERRKDVPTQLKNNMYKENKRKRPSSMSEKSQEDTCPNEDVEKDMGHKRQRLTSKHDASSCEEPQNLPSSGQKEATTSDKEESHKTAKDKASSNMNYQQAAQLWQYVKRKSREPVVGLSALLECHCDQCDPIYLCECCSLKIPEKDIVSHITGFDHQKMYLGLQKLPTPPWNHQRMTIRQRALLLEKDEGYGDAQVVDVDEEIYNNISKQNFKSAIQTVKALQAQQESRRELPSTCALSAVQPVDTSVTLHAQYEVYSLTDDFQVSQFGINQVVEIDDHSEDSEAQPSSVTATESVMTETTCKTTQVPPESADNANTCLTVSRSSEDTSSLHVSTCGTNTTRLQPDSTEKAEIISNTMVGPLKIATTSKIVGTCTLLGTAATSDSTVTTPTKSTTAVSKCTVESSNSTSDTTKSTAPISKLTVPSSSCNTATTKLRETAYKCVANTSSATASTTKLTAANPNSSTTTTISTAPTYSCTTTTTNCRETAFKGVSSTSSVTATTSKFTATVSKLTGTTSTSSVNISGATSTTKSATVSKPLESRTGAASMQVAVTSNKAATVSNTVSRVVREATSRTVPAPKIENTSKNSETAFKSAVTSHTMVTSGTAKMTKMSVKCENTEASPKTVHMKNSVGSNADVAPNIPKSKAPEAPHLMSVRSENRSPSTEPSHTSTSKTKPHESSPRVGLNMLIVVRCEGRQQIYCQLCSVKLLSSTHLRSYNHKYNYVKKMIPECTAKPSECAKLDKMVALLAEVEKVAGSRSPETIEVKNDVYEELAVLPEDKAVERLKEMVRQRDLRDSSSSTTNAAEVLRQQVAFASPCEVSSPDDGMYMPQNEMAGLSTDNQSEQENKHELQKLLVQMPEIESISEEDGNLAPGQSDKAQSFYGKSPQANDLISDQLHLCPTLINDPKPITTPIIQDADVAVKVEQETLEYDVESQATVDVTPAIDSQVKMEKLQGWADPLATDSESTGRFAQTPDTCQETPEKGQQQERSDPELQDTQKVLEGTQKTSPVKIFNPDPLFSATSVNTEVQQNQSRPSQKTEHVPKHSGCSPGPWHHSGSQALPIFSIGERTQGPSHLSSWLKVKGLETEPVIGLGSVWECRGIGLGSKFLNSFFLCESCSETLSTNDICQHMVSSDHQRKYMKRHYPEFLYWLKDDLDEDMKLEVLNGIAWMLSPREREIDAQCILLKRELYEYVRKAPFSEALNIVQEFEKEPKQRVFCLPICTPRQKDQQLEDRQSLEESLPTEMQSAQALETDQRSDNEARQKTEKHHLEETAMVGDLDGVKQRRVLSPLDVTSVSSKADSVVSPFPSAGTCLSPQETSRIISMQPELRPPVSQQQRPFPELQVKRTEVQSLSSSIVSPSQTLSMPPRDKCLPTRKRPAVTSVETLVRPCTNNPQLEDPLPAKYIRTCRSLQPIRQPSLESASEFTPVNPAATSILLSPKDEDTGPGFDKQDASIVDSTHIAHLIALLREMKSEKKVFPCMSAPDNAETTTSCASPKSGVDRRWDPKRVQTTSTMAKRRRWDSKCQLVKATVKKNLPPTNSLEGMVSTAAPVVFGCDSQLVTPNANSAFSANNSSLEGYLMRGNLLFRATETQAVGTMLPSASTADRSDPQRQGSVNAQRVFGNVSLFKPSPYFVASNPGQIPQPRCNSETGSTGICQLPINTIITARPDPTNHQFMGGFKGQDHTKANRGNQVSHSVSTDLTASPSDTLAASGGYGQYSQMACVANGHSGYLSSEAVAGYITPYNPPVYTGSLYQHEGYTKKGLYPSQIYPEQEANRFGHSLATPSAGWVRLETQQQQQLAQQQQQQTQQQQQQAQQQQQQQTQQKQPIQQQRQQLQLTLQQGSSWTSAALAAGNGKVNSEAACLGAVQFPTPANNSQRLIERMNDYSTNRIIPAQTSNNIITQNTPQVYLSPPVIHYSPTANSEFLAQASANSFYASGRGVFIVAPSMVNATPPVSHETTR